MPVLKESTLLNISSVDLSPKPQPCFSNCPFDVSTWMHLIVTWHLTCPKQKPWLPVFHLPAPESFFHLCNWKLQPFHRSSEQLYVRPWLYAFSHTPYLIFWNPVGATLKIRTSRIQPFLTITTAITRTQTAIIAHLVYFWWSNWASRSHLWSLHSTLCRASKSRLS